MLAFSTKQNQSQEKKSPGAGLHDLATAATPSSRSGHDFSRVPLYANSTGGALTSEARETAAAPPLAHEVVRSSGQPLDATTRAFFEPRLGHSFGHVRVHTGQRAADSALELGARAYTLGQHVVLGGGAPPVNTEAGRKLLAHELTHVAQQRAGRSVAAGTSDIRRAEAEASHAAEHVAAGHAVAGSPLPIQAPAPQTVPLLAPGPGGTDPTGLQEPTPGASLTPAGPRMTTTSEVLKGFATDSAELTPEHKATIQKIADDLNQSPLVLGGFVSIVGETDKRGTEDYNQALGQKRADAVRDELVGLVTDEETRSQIRAHSLGEPAEGPTKDDPELRRVTITVTRRTLDLGPPAPTPSITPQTLPPVSPGISPITRDIVFPPATPTLPGPRRPPPPNFPPWMWQKIQTAPPPPPDFLNQLSQWITGSLKRADIARVAARLASTFGLDENETRKALDDAMVKGGEEGLKQVLKAILQGVAGQPSTPPPNPTGPPLQERPMPGTLSGPPIPF